MLPHLLQRTHSRSRRCGSWRGRGSWCSELLVRGHLGGGRGREVAGRRGAEGLKVGVEALGVGYGFRTDVVLSTACQYCGVMRKGRTGLTVQGRDRGL